MDPLLRRYRSGDHDAVWKLLTPADGQAVAQETMTRVRHNLELLEQRLRETGYAFAEDVCPAFSPPPEETPDTFRRIEELFGPLPLALRAFFEAVGGVDFRPPGGEYAGEAWSGLHMPDPLVVWPLRDSFDGTLEEWESLTAEERGSTAFSLDFAPDVYHKDDISGGAPYSIALPNAAVDPDVLGDAPGGTFLGHLRLAIRHGGFLRPLSQGFPAAAVEGLTRDLLPF